MKTTAILYLAYLALCVQCSVPENKSTKKEINTQPIKVGVFDGHGGAPVSYTHLTLPTKA